jgi:hypothetical protein
MKDLHIQCSLWYSLYWFLCLQAFFMNNDFHMCGRFVGATARFKQEHLFGNLGNSASSKSQVETWHVKTHVSPCFYETNVYLSHE